MYTYSIFGCTLASDRPFRTLLPSAEHRPDLVFAMVDDSPIGRDWRASPPMLQSALRNETGEPLFTIHRGRECDVMHFTDVADFFLWPERILCQLLDTSARATVTAELSFLGVVLSHWLERRGVLVLHASCIRTGSRAAAFLAVKEGGKSSLAAALLQHGCSLLSDDLVPVRLEDGRFMAHPAYPQMRLWPREAQHFLGRFEDLDRVHPSVTKRRVPIGAHGLGTFSSRPAPLTCIYIPERRGPEASVEIRPRAASEALIDLVRHSFTPNLVHAAGLQPRRLEAMARLIEQTRFRTLIYPSGLGRLSTVAEMILDDVHEHEAVIGQGTAAASPGDIQGMREV
jgi:hypothetical protein